MLKLIAERAQPGGSLKRVPSAGTTWDRTERWRLLMVRAWQRATWLRFRWHEAPLSQTAVPWRHVYVQGRTADSAEASLDRVHGDTVTLSAVSEGYRSLVHKTFEALRWAQAVRRPLPTPRRRRCQPGRQG